MLDQRLSPPQLLMTVFMLLVSPGVYSASAGEVDLESAGCPAPPEEGRFMSVHVILDGEGNGRDCVISSEPKHHCEQYHSFEEGFLCLGITHNPRPDITAAETTNSKRVNRLEVDGEVVEDDYGRTILRKDLGTGPSGNNYNVMVEHDLFGKTYTLTVGVSAEPDGPIKFDSVQITYEE